MQYDFLYLLKKELETQYKKYGEKTILNGCDRREDDIYEWICFDIIIVGKEWYDYPYFSNLFKRDKKTGQVFQVYDIDDFIYYATIY